MAYQIGYSPNVQEEIREILIYLLEEWNFEVSENFSNYLISSVREFRVKPHYLVYYSVLEEQQLIHVLNIVDSRRKR